MNGFSGQPLSFIEREYLAANPDVAAAVSLGAFRTGWEHYEAFGRVEGRNLSLLNSREALLLSQIDLASSRGIEIGALDKPLVTKRESKMFYVDYADTEYLREHYRDDPGVDKSKIVDVDGVWGQYTLSEAIGVETRVDYVLASHVIEHIPDLISWIIEINSVLIEGGVLRLAIPDRRFTFDFGRNETALTDVIDAYLRRARKPLPRQILDHCLNVRKVDAASAWERVLDIRELPREFTDRDALTIAKDAHDNGTYHDVHCWVFTPASFINLMKEIVELGLIDMSCEFIAETRRGHNEFIVSLRSGTSNQTTLNSWLSPILI